MFQGLQCPFGIFCAAEFFGYFLLQLRKEAEINIGWLKALGICCCQMCDKGTERCFGGRHNGFFPCYKPGSVYAGKQPHCS